MSHKTRKIERLLEKHPEHAKAFKINCRMRVVPRAEAEKGFEVPADYMFFGIDWQTLNVLVIERLGMDEGAKK